MNATRRQLRAQYDRAKKLGWIDHFRESANTHTPGLFDAADLLGIGSRETNLDPKWLQKKGDNGHGAGLMQIDDRSFPAFTNSTKWKDARLGILYGGTVLRQKWDDLERNAGKQLSVKGRKYTCPRAKGRLAQEIAISSYNCGRWAQYAASRGADVDAYTTGKDYSADVMARAAVFREYLAADGLLDRNIAPSGPDDPHAGPQPTGAPDTGLAEDLSDQFSATPQAAVPHAGIPTADPEKPFHQSHSDTLQDTPPAAPATDLAAQIEAAAGQPTQVAETIVNTGDNAAPPPDPVPVTVGAPAADNTTKKAATATFLGFAVPASVAGVLKAGEQAAEKGWINVGEIFSAVFQFMAGNVKWIAILVGLYFLSQMLKKAYKQITLWISMLTHAIPTWNNVKVQPTVAPEPEPTSWWKFWKA